MTNRTTQHRDPRRVSLRVLVIGVAAALVVGFGAGWWGHAARSVATPLAAAVSAVEQHTARRDATAPDADATRELQGALFDSWMNSLRLAARARSLESLIAEMEARDVEPQALVRGVVSEMSEKELELTIAAATDFDSEDLAEVEDVRQFAVRLADIAMDGLIVEPSDESGTARVVFSPSSDASEASDRFREDAGRIYAIFSTEDYALGTVMLKWFRVDEPQLMLFRRFKIVPGRDSGWVWVDGERTWAPGDYQVDVYTGDEAMERIGVGRFVVEPLDS